MSQIITAAKLRELLDARAAQGVRLAGPCRVERPFQKGDRHLAATSSGPENRCGLGASPLLETPSKPGLVMYRRLASAAELALDGFVHPANSIKEFLLPQCETLYEYHFEGKQVELTPAPEPAEQIIVGARPCDAAAMAILESVFDWGSRDAHFFRRRERTTIVTLACREPDAACFCTTVGSGPRDQRGSDALLVALDNGTYEVTCLTDKGTQLFSGSSSPLPSDGRGAGGEGGGKHLPLPTPLTPNPSPAERERGTGAPTPTDAPASIIDLDLVGRFLATRWDDPLWQAATAACLGCGACAYTCPTCHCFDIHDEGTARSGSRVRTWDACQFALFTAHASGHNPRSVQPQRQRQRIYHKFQTYPERFGEILCTGCGNCTRNCPVGLGVRPVLQRLAEEMRAR